jgi:hypothetical protein
MHVFTVVNPPQQRNSRPRRALLRERRHRAEFSALRRSASCELAAQLKTPSHPVIVQPSNRFVRKIFAAFCFIRRRAIIDGVKYAMTTNTNNTYPATIRIRHLQSGPFASDSRRVSSRREHRSGYQSVVRNDNDGARGARASFDRVWRKLATVAAKVNRLMPWPQLIRHVPAAYYRDMSIPVLEFDSGSERIY